MLVYCDFIAREIRNGLVTVMNDPFQPIKLTDVTKVKWDLGPNDEFLSTKKTMHVTDQNGRLYRVTVEEA